MPWDLTKANLLYRRPEYDQNEQAFLEGDVWEFTEPPFYEIDPITYETKPTLQCFRVGRELSLMPVTRNSWT